MHFNMLSSQLEKASIFHPKMDGKLLRKFTCTECEQFGTATAHKQHLRSSVY